MPIFNNVSIIFTLTLRLVKKSIENSSKNRIVFPRAFYRILLSCLKNGKADCLRDWLQNEKKSIEKSKIKEMKSIEESCVKSTKGMSKICLFVKLLLAIFRFKEAWLHFLSNKFQRQTFLKVKYLYFGNIFYMYMCFWTLRNGECWAA